MELEEAFDIDIQDKDITNLFGEEVAEHQIGHEYGPAPVKEIVNYISKKI